MSLLEINGQARDVTVKAIKILRAWPERNENVRDASDFVGELARLGEFDKDLQMTDEQKRALGLFAIAEMSVLSGGINVEEDLISEVGLPALFEHLVYAAKDSLEEDVVNEGHFNTVDSLIHFGDWSFADDFSYEQQVFLASVFVTVLGENAD